MANQFAAKIPITLDRERTLLFDLNTFAEFEGVMGASITWYASQWIQQKLGLREMRALVWAGLLHEDPTLTLQEAGRLISEHGPGKNLGETLTYLAEIFSKAMVTIIGEPDEKKRVQNEPTKSGSSASAGTGSG